MNQPLPGPQSPDRRTFLCQSAAAAALAALPSALFADDAPALSVAGPRYPEKNDLILLTDRPPNLETPLKAFRDDLTPNDAFFVRWHLGIIPTRVDLATFRLSIGGYVEKPLSLSVADLKQQFQATSVVAVNQCSGNSRSFFAPRVPGGQWGHGAMGNAKWTGVPLKDLLAQAKIRAGAVDVAFNGLDSATLPKVDPNPGTPDFVKSLAIDKALDADVLVAYEMNGQPLPMLNGFPLRLVVPGWYATYWIKALSEITVLDKLFDGFWMATAYRVPSNPDCVETPDNLAKQTVPISRMTLRSIFVSPEPSQMVQAGVPIEVMGLAVDSGHGISRVEVSTDGGQTWKDATLDADLGKFSWRRWRLAWTPQPGPHTLQCRATNAKNETQTTTHWNRSGYARNLIESLSITAK